MRKPGSILIEDKKIYLSHTCAGFSLPEMLVTIGLVGILTLSINIAAVDMFKNSQAVSLKLSRDQIVNQIRSVAFNKKAVALTLSKKTGGARVNPEFYDCACGAGTCTSMKQPFPAITLYDWAGNVQSPTYYDASGSSCDPTKSGLCAIRVTTSFFAECGPDLTQANQNPPLTCNGIPAEFVGIYYTIDQNPNVQSLQIPLKPIVGQVFIQTTDLDKSACL